jgi:hypothetical protein
MAKRKKSVKRKTYDQLIIRKEKLTPYKEILRDNFAVAAIGGLIAARGMEVVNPTHMVKNAWGFADQMMEYRNWVDDDEQVDESVPASTLVKAVKAVINPPVTQSRPKSAPDAIIEATLPSEEGPD